MVIFFPGCSACDCGVASDSRQCDDQTGLCRCKAGVTGRTCNKCAAGFWNYTEEGCVCKFDMIVNRKILQSNIFNLACGCKGEYSIGVGCNAETGQCECLPNVVGEKCDQCPYRWVFIPDSGCQECDSCHHALLNDTDALAALIDPIIIEFDVSEFINTL